MEELTKASLAELRQMAKELGISGCSTKKKNELIEILSSAGNSSFTKKEKVETAAAEKAENKKETAERTATKTGGAKTAETKAVAKEAVSGKAAAKKTEAETAGSKTAGSKSAETKAAETKTAETKADESKAAETKVEEAKSTETKPEEMSQKQTVRENQKAENGAAQAKQEARKVPQKTVVRRVVGNPITRTTGEPSAMRNTESRPVRYSEEANRYGQPARNGEDASRYGQPTRNGEEASRYGQPARSSEESIRYTQQNRVGEENARYGQQQRSDVSQNDSGISKTGILEIMPEQSFGFIRNENYLPSPDDVYVSPQLIKRYNLSTGDIICGNLKVKSPQEKFVAMLYITKINGENPELSARRKRFDKLTPVFPHERLRLETEGGPVSTRVVDLLAPVGKGQRGMIVSPPKAGKTTLLKDIARAIQKNNPKLHMIILLIDERPEEVTDMKDSIKGENVEIIYSTFDEAPEQHKRVSEMTVEHAKRLVEYGKDVIILLDSITRLARACNLTCQSSGRTLSGGLDPAALYMPKRFFGAARCMKEGGSLTILATALVDTGSRMDDVVFEEFKGTGNMELTLNRTLSERRIFPAIDLPKSSTRREDLLLSPVEQEANIIMRRAFGGARAEEATEQIVNMFTHTRSNAEFITQLKRTRIFG